MKQLRGFALILLIVFVGYSTNSQGIGLPSNSDISPNAVGISSIAFNTSSATAGDTVLLTVDFTASVTANYFTAVLLAYNGSDYNGFLNLKLYQDSANTLRYEGSFTVLSYMQSGNVTVDSLRDDAFAYYFDKFFDYTTPFVIVSGTTPDVTDPVLNDIYFDKTTVSFGEDITLYADITDDSPVEVSFDLYLPAYSFSAGSYVMEYVANTTYRAVISIDGTFTVDEYGVNALTITDFNSNTIYPTTSITFSVVENTNTDTTAPVVNNSRFDKERIYQGESITFSIDVFDDSNISSVQFSLNRDSDSQSVGTYSMSPSSGNTYQTVISTDSSFALDYYYVEWVKATDAAGNLNFKNFTFLIVPYFEVLNGSTDGDNAAPVLDSAGFDRNQVKQDDTVTFTASISDNSSITEVRVNIVRDDLTSMGWFSMQLVDGNYQVSVLVNESFTPAFYSAATVYAVDEFGNEMEQQTLKSFQVLAANETLPGEEIILSFDGVLSFNKPNVSSNEVFSLTADFSNFSLVFTEVQVTIMKEGSEEGKIFQMDASVNNTFVLKLNSSDFSDKIYVSKIVVFTEDKVYGQEWEADEAPSVLVLPDPGPIVVNSFKFTSSSLTWGDNMTFVANVTHDFEIVYFEVMIASLESVKVNKAFYFKFYPELDEDGTFTATFLINQSFPAGEYNIWTYTIKDEVGNVLDISVFSGLEVVVDREGSFSLGSGATYPELNENFTVTTPTPGFGIFMAMLAIVAGGIFVRKKRIAS